MDSDHREARVNSLHKTKMATAAEEDTEESGCRHAAMKDHVIHHHDKP